MQKDMELFNKNIAELSNTEINLLIIKIKEEHEATKNRIIASTLEMESIEKKINADLELLEKYENKYIQIVNELINRE